MQETLVAQKLTLDKVCGDKPSQLKVAKERVQDACALEVT